MCARVHIGESDHHIGLNTLPDSIDRKRCNGMLCLSAQRKRERETIIISSSPNAMLYSLADVAFFMSEQERKSSEQA